MQIQNLTIFRLNYSGEVEECGQECANPVELFTSVNVLAIYVRANKRLYIWIGENVSNTLKNYISQLRELVTNQYPDLRVLRYITVEAKTEPYDFFQSVGISKEDLQAFYKSEEDKISPVLDDIKDLKSRADRAYEEENYDEAIDHAEKIIELAIQIQDDSLKRDQEEFIGLIRQETDQKILLKSFESDLHQIKAKMDQIYIPQEITELIENLKSLEKQYAEIIEKTDNQDIGVLTEELNERLTKIEEKEKEKQSIDDILEKIKPLRLEGVEQIEKGNITQSYVHFSRIINILTKYREQNQ